MAWRVLSAPRTLFGAMVVATGLGLLLPALLIGALWAGWLEPRQARQAQQAQLDVTLDMLAGSLPDVLWNLEQVPAAQIVGAVMRAPDVLRVQIHDTSQGQDFIDLHRPEPAAGTSLSGRRDVLRNGVRVGWVQVALSSASVTAEQRRLRLVFQGMVAGQLGMSLLLVLVLLHFRVNRPLGTLSRFADDLARGDFGAPLAPSGGDEIRAVASHLAQMREALAAQFVAQQQLLDRLRGVAETVPGVLFQLHADAQGTLRFDYVSEAARDSFGLAPAALLADVQAWWDVVHPSDQAALRASLQVSARDGQAWREEFRLGRADTPAAQRWMLVHAVVQRHADGSATWYGIQSDISRQRRDAAELLAHRHHLEALVQQRTHALAEATDAAQVASRAKTAFLRNMSHEMRTPLNAILGLTTLMQRQPADDGQRRRLAQVSEAAQQLLGTISNLLDLARVEAGQLALAPEPFTADALMAELAAWLAPQAEARQLALELTLGPGLAGQWLLADGRRIGEVLRNLTGNALKFTERGAVRLVARLEPLDGDGGMLRFEVQDSGIGIDPEVLGRLFQDFEQADSSLTRRHGGSGLGLAISRRLVALMGGMIDVTSQPGQGSRFWFTVPVRRLVSGAAVPAEPPVVPAVGNPSTDPFEPLHPFRGARVLLAEDDAVNQQVAVAMLVRAGLRVDVAGDGAQAVAMAQQQAYDLVLMDLQMPVMDGLEAARRLRRGVLPPGVPILAVTAHAFDDERRLCLEAGMNDHLSKPLQASQLSETLARWLARAASRR